MSNVTCGIYPITTMTSMVCGGHGTCQFSVALNRGICMCEAGWHGETDFQVTTSLTNCHVSDQILTILWGIYLAIHLLVGLFVIAPKIHSIHDMHYMRTGNSVYLCVNRKTGLFPQSFYLILGYPAQLAYAVIKLSDPSANLGRSAAITALYIIWRVSFYLSNHLFILSLLSSILHNQAKFAVVLKRITVLSSIFLVIITSLSIAPLVPLVGGPVDPFNPVLGMVPVAVFFNVCCMGFFYFAWVAHYARFRILSSDIHTTLIRKSKEAMTNPEKNTLLLLWKFSNLMKSTRNMAVSQFVLYAVFGILPILWQCHDYLLPFTWLPVLAVNVNVLSSVVRDDAQYENSSEREDTVGQMRGHKTKAATTVVNTQDVQSAIDVDFDHPALLDTSHGWKNNTSDPSQKS